MESSSDSEIDAKDNKISSGKKKHVEFKYKCSYEICGQLFRRQVAYDKHIFTHTGIKKYECMENGCDKKYTNSSHLKRHIQSAHKPELNALNNFYVKCKDEKCHKVFTNDCNMKRHYKNHHENLKTYDCCHCNEKFKRKEQLRRHMFKHSGIYPHNCDVCNIGFTNKSFFDKHYATHNVRTCKICNTEFKNWSELVKHKRAKHCTIYKCEHCEKIFYSRCRLKIHAITHKPQEEIEYFCCTHEGCSKMYNKKSNLTAHIRRKHDEKKFICPVVGCGKTFSTKRSLEKHSKIHLPINNSNKNQKKKLNKIRAKRKDAGEQKLSTATKITCVKTNPQIENTILAGHGSNLLIEYQPPISCGSESATDTDTESLINRQIKCT